MRPFIVGLFFAVSVVSEASADTLYTNESGWLYSVSQLTGAALTEVGSCSCNHFATGLSTRPGVSANLYGVVNDNSTWGRLARVSTSSGSQFWFPLFSEAALGFKKPYAQGIAISQLHPDIAVVTGFDSDFQGGSATFFQNFVWTVDLNTGAVLTPGIPNPAGVGSITYSLDGTTLFGADNVGRLVTLDPATGAATLVGDPGLSDFITGLAFRPSDNTLFAIDGGTHDQTVILNPNNGSVVTTLGSIHLGGAYGLAFVIPEPSTIVLVITAVGFLPLRCRR